MISPGRESDEQTFSWPDGGNTPFRGEKGTTNVPLVTNLRQDPWERYPDQSMMYARWWGEKLWTMVPAVTLVGGFLQTFKEYPPSQAGG